MAGNSFGQLFVVSSFGESHGPAIGCMVDGCPAGLKLCEADIQKELARRRPGHSHYTSQRREPDEVKILSGVFEGQTTGTPIGLLIENQDSKSKDYAAIKDKYRPGHGDWVYEQKYGLRDYRGGGRASARETAMRVAAGAIAKKYLYHYHGTTIQAYTSQVGDLVPQTIDLAFAESNAFYFPDPNGIAAIEDLITALRRDGDSIGSKIHAVVEQVPVGLGEPVFDKLDGALAGALMGINAVKGVAIGAGFDCVRLKGKEMRDEMTPDGFLSNTAGGILAGISTGQAIELDVAVKAPSSIRCPANTIDCFGAPTTIQTLGRHDTCLAFRAVPVVEAMISLVLMDHVLRQRGQNGAS